MRYSIAVSGNTVAAAMIQTGNRRLAMLTFAVGLGLSAAPYAFPSANAPWYVVVACAIGFPGCLIATLRLGVGDLVFLVPSRK